jgi:hypothetical protein
LDYFTQEEMVDISRVAKELLFDGPGQINVNHALCSAGQDTKKRLYIRITEDGSRLLAFCHHCNRRGMQKRSLLARFPTTEAAVATWDDKAGQEELNPLSVRWHEAIKEYNGATPMVVGPGKLPHAMYGLFPLKFFAVEHFNMLIERDFYGMRYTPSSVIIPRYGETGLLGLDKRALARSDHPSAPKWQRILALASDGSEVAGRLIIYNTTQSKIGVIVEDPISAMRVDLLGYGAIALTGSSLSPDDAFKLSLLFDSIVVWLDNDNATVLKNATAAAMRLRMYNLNKVGLVHNLCDPKRLTDDQITRAIQEALR